MGRVHTPEPYNGIEIAYETTWGVVQTTGFVRVPYVVEPGESLRITQEVVNPPRGMTSGGARSEFDYGRRFVEGEITLRPAYNSQSIGMLLKELCGGIDINAATASPTGGGAPGGAPSGYATHEFLQNTYTATTAGYEGGVGKGLTIRAWKSGTNDTGTIDRFVGCIVTKLKISQPENGPMVWTFTFIGKQLSQLAATGLTIQAVPANLVIARFRDFKNNNKLTHPVCNAIFAVKADLSVDYHVRSFECTFDTKIELDRAFITNPDDVQKPAHVDKWEVTGQMVTSLQQDYGAVGRPHYEFVNGLASALRIRWVSESLAFDGGSDANRMPWALDLWLKSIDWADSKPNLSEPGNPPHPIQFRSQLGTYTAGQHANISSPSGLFLLQLVGQAANF